MIYCHHFRQTFFYVVKPHTFVPNKTKSTFTGRPIGFQKDKYFIITQTHLPHFVVLIITVVVVVVIVITGGRSVCVELFLCYSSGNLNISQRRNYIYHYDYYYHTLLLLILLRKKKQKKTFR